MTLLLGAQLAALVFFVLPPGRLGLVRAVTVDQWRAIDAETRREPGEAGHTSVGVLIVLVTAAVALTLQHYLGDSQTYETLFPRGFDDDYYDLGGFAWWAGWRITGYVAIPLLVLAITGEQVGDFYLSARGLFRHLWIYIALYLCVLPAVIAASDSQAFRDTYPFYRLANRSGFDLWMWELLYAAQFVALEVFFRGVLLHGLRRALGANAVFVMVVPYCMIHYGKPLAETLGAIGAGLILGTLAMRTRSIWGGVLIHVGVAVTMDVLALRGFPPMDSSLYTGE
jgi:membrane protease YdiL (CAAX protease family)